MSVSERPAAVGDNIAGRYRIEQELGRGGMGAVYRVHDERNGKQLALKRGWARDPRRAQQRAALLEREYHTLAQLSHPRIIEVYEYGLDAGGPYYTMELLQGSDLDKRERQPWQEQCSLLYDVASSLAILHARGLIHRDVSPRNVRCTPEGRAKLIDFGAMTPMGAVHDMVGTPPFVAPEVLQMQELDARADLYSLGALGYYLLTGRNAYPARKMKELRDMWRSRPHPPVKLAPDVPPALSALIMELLQLDRSARPRSAAEVMERLAAIAGISREEKIEVSRAYLTTPALVGRDKALVLARRQLLSLVRREGGCLAIEGVAGAGRSRMLDACVLEAKLLGASVVRAGAGCGQEDWAVARVLCAQLFELVPKEAHEAARLTRDVLGHVIEELAGEGLVSTVVPERSVLLRALRDFVLSLTRIQRLLVVVDDVDRIDEPSAALLAALAHKSERDGLLIAVSIDRDRDQESTTSLRLLRRMALRIEIEQLQPDETLVLMRSLFGDVANVQFVAGKIHALAQGNPRATLDLARHLCDRKLARYQAGSWTLPSELDAGDLPSTLADALATRLTALGSDARALLEASCLAEGDALTLEDYRQLLPLAEHARVFKAIDELLAARILMTEGARYRFSQGGFVPVVRDSMTAERKRAVHARLAEVLAKTGGDVLQRAEHLLRAGVSRDAIELLSSINLQLHVPSLPLLELAVAEAEALAMPPRTIHQLQLALLGKASAMRASDTFRKFLPRVLSQLERDSGLALYRELAHLPAEERLGQALTRTHQLQLATPEHERIYGVVNAIRELARLAGALCTFAVQLNDMDAIEALPSLEPLLPLSPALAIVDRLVTLSKCWIAGRFLDHRRMTFECLALIDRPDRGGLEEMQHKRTRMALHYGCALFEAMFGVPIEERAQILEGEREWRVNAWRMRMLMLLSQGNSEEARKCERRAELLLLQERSDQSYSNMGVTFELMGLAECDDLVGVKAALETLTALAGNFPGWRPALAYGHCRYRWLQGDLQGALDALLAGFEYAPLLRHNARCWLSGAHVRLLTELGRHEEAVRIGSDYLELFERERLVQPDHGVSLGLARALSATGEHERAVQAIENAIAESTHLGSIGLALGRLYQARAEIAIRMRDREGYERFAQACTVEYNRAKNPALGARCVRLLELAREYGLAEAEPPPELRELLLSSAPESEYNTVHSRILECVDDLDRARCALTLLLQSTDASAGYLFGIRANRPMLLAALPEFAVDDQLTAWIEARLLDELASSADVTADSAADTASPLVSDRFVDSEGHTLTAVFLCAHVQQSTRIAAILALQMPGGARNQPARHLLETLAQELLDHGDVSGVQLDELATM